MNTMKKASTKHGRRRPVHFVLRDEDCPGLIDFLDSLEDRMAGRTLRAILFGWVEEQNRKGNADLIAAATQAVNDHDFAVLQRKVQTAGTGRSFVPTQIEPRRGTDVEERIQPDPSLTSGLTVVDPPVASTPATAAPVTLKSDPEPPREDPKSVAPLPDDAGVDFLDSMLGLN